MAGARAVQVGTANFFNPKAALDVVEGLEGYCQEEAIQSIEDIVGAAL
jgi:dihydroorotate dehydrogenase (NAD+) catalytic subunit